MSPFRKHDQHAPAGFYATEAAGLRWLGAAAGGVPVAEVLAVDDVSIELTRYPTTSVTASAAREFGERLARTHRAGAPHHGAAAPGADPAGGFIGPLPMPHLIDPDPAGWGGFYARCRVRPFAEAATANGALSAAGADVVHQVWERLEAAEADLTGPPGPAARLHGDLWSGNVLWTAEGARLIDPAAHGGHPETDLAMLTLFGLPYLDDVRAGYERVSPLEAGWAGRVGLHQLHPLLVHAVLFGPSYGAQAASVAARYV
ncbi:fructosamine kinase family protein [Spongisporangium articulatum]|uniref:Fructosamine kinase family protein n=1 Tax=Spongisporangium articulatum TaxID=3362603 RepID=A0ABW8AK27_9ACTN